MRTIAISLAAAAFSSLLIGAVVAQAVQAPVASKTEVVTPVWNTTLTRE